MDRYPRYHPPALTELVTIRNPADRPEATQDRYGRVTQPDWGARVLANRRDRAPYTSYEEQATVLVGLTIWTIRDRPNVAHDVEVVTSDGQVYEPVGPPVQRGSWNGGRASRYLELNTRRRQT